MNEDTNSPSSSEAVTSEYLVCVVKGELGIRDGVGEPRFSQ